MRPMTGPAPAAERAVALLLAPVLLLVMLALAAIAIDLSALHSAHRSIHRVVSTAADDAAGLVDGHHLQLTGVTRIDRDEAARLVAARFDVAELPGRLAGDPVVVVDDSARAVTVRASVDVDHVITRSLTSRSTTTRLDVTASARMTP